MKVIYGRAFAEDFLSPELKHNETKMLAMVHLYLRKANAL
ncbi:hypothetical protein [Mycobacterium leprae]|nr:hypothetical protein [Mycobacterium leprae]